MCPNSTVKTKFVVFLDKSFEESDQLFCCVFPHKGVKSHLNTIENFFTTLLG